MSINEEDHREALKEVFKNDKTHERVHFRLIEMPCCGQLLCWVNPRFPSYCPECGKFVYLNIKGCITFEDNEATLTIKETLS
jgi:hypothetical protein